MIDFASPVLIILIWSFNEIELFLLTSRSRICLLNDWNDHGLKTILVQHLYTLWMNFYMWWQLRTLWFWKAVSGNLSHLHVILILKPSFSHIPVILTTSLSFSTHSYHSHHPPPYYCQAQVLVISRWTLKVSISSSMSISNL